MKFSRARDKSLLEKIFSTLKEGKAKFLAFNIKENEARKNGLILRAFGVA